LATEETFDIGQLCQGFVATILGFDMLGRKAETAMNAVPMTVAVDAKDVHDKGNSDTASYGSQKVFSVHCGMDSFSAEKTEYSSQMDLYRKYVD